MKNKLVFKTNLYQDGNREKFCLLSLWDNGIDFTYIFRFEHDNHIFRMELTLDLNGLGVAVASPYGVSQTINVSYYKGLWDTFKPTINPNEVRTLSDCFKIFIGSVWALPVKLIE